ISGGDNRSEKRFLLFLDDGPGVCQRLGCLRGGCGGVQGDRDLLDDFQAETFECRDVHGGVGEQADALDAEVGEDLAAQANGAENAAGAVLRGFPCAKFLMEDEARGLRRINARGWNDASWLKRRVIRLRLGGRVVDLESA